jgi:hypothetical protein
MMIIEEYPEDFLAKMVIRKSPPKLQIPPNEFSGCGLSVHLPPPTLRI